jgi:hypothetical protein
MLKAFYQSFIFQTLFNGHRVGMFNSNVVVGNFFFEISQYDT